MFADDANIYGNVDHGVNDTIENVSVWMESNKLAINRDKCKAISFGATNETPEIKIHDYNIQFVDHIKYLGVYIDSKLSFKSHIEKIIRRMISLTAAIYQYKKIFKRLILVWLYKVYVQPVIQYGVLLYGVANKSDLQKLEWRQSRIFRLLFSAKRFQSIDELRWKHKLFSVKELHIYELIKLLSRVLRHEHPSKLLNNSFHELIEENIQINERTHPLKTKFFQTKRRIKSLIKRLRHLYNVLTKMDESMVQKLCSFSAQELANFLHCYRDSFIIDNGIFVNLSW